MHRTRQFLLRSPFCKAIFGAVRNAALVVLLLLHPPAILAQSDATVEVTITGVKDELLTNVRGFMPLYAFDKKPAPSEGRLRFLHAQAEDKVLEALAPFGYYRPTVTSSLELTDGVWQAKYDISQGDRIPLTSVDIKVTGEAETDNAYSEAIRDSSLREGQPLIDANYESLKQRFQVLASERGYFDAKLTESRIRINREKYEAGIVLHFDSGERYYLGEVSFVQDKSWLREELLFRYSEIVPGEPFLAADLQQLQGALSNTQYFSQVTLDVSPENADENNVIPVVVNLTARNPTRYSFGGGFGTDTGFRLKAGITKRRVNKAGHHYTAEALVAQKRLGIAGEYIIPAVIHALMSGASAVRSRMRMIRPTSPRQAWVVSIGVETGYG